VKAALPRLHVQLLAHQPYLGNQHLALHFSQPLLAAGEFRDLTPGPNALDDIDKCTPLMQHILHKQTDNEDE
jgi:hypothetical protein